MTFGPALFWKDGIGPSVEPLRIIIARGDLDDAARGRRIPYKIYYPAPETGVRDMPVILWSHGLGGSRDGAGFLARFLASHGYVVCNLQHKGTDSALWEGKPGHPWDVIRDTPIPRSAVLDRFRDVPFVLDHLDVIAQGHPDAGAAMGRAVFGMSGHSFGAMTTQVMAGQAVVGEDGHLASLREDRFRAGILYSPVPAPPQRPKTVYDGIAMPLFHMTGTADESPIEHFGYRDRLAVYDHSGRAERQRLILEGGDHMVYSGSRGQLAPNPKRSVHEAIIKIGALAYWDSYLKDDKAARQWLTGGGFSTWIGDEAAYNFSKPVLEKRSG